MRLTIGMAVHGDAQGAWWTLSSLRLHHLQADLPGVELLVIDDMESPCQDLIHAAALAKARYIHRPKGQGPAHAKNTVFENARGDYVLLLDSHVMLAPCAVDHLLHGIVMDTVGQDMWTGPLVNESAEVIATELLPELRGGMLGIWHTRKTHEPTYEIEAHGSAFMFMRRECWPGFSLRFYGFAGEEVYIHEKVRRNGGRVICHDALKWVHRFQRFGVPITYRLTLNDKYRNLLVGAYEMNWAVGQVKDYFRKRLPEDQATVVEAEVAAVCPDIWSQDDSSARRFRVHD